MRKWVFLLAAAVLVAVVGFWPVRAPERAGAPVRDDPAIRAIPQPSAYVAPTHPVSFDRKSDEPAVADTASAAFFGGPIVYRGRVLTPAGLPQADAEVWLMEPMIEGPGSEFGARTDEWGAFTFHARDGAWLEARHPAYLPGRTRVDLAAQASRRVEIRLADAFSGDASRRILLSIAGRVVDSAGQPIAEATVEAYRADTSRRTRSGADGSFVVEGLDASAHEVTAAHPDFAPATLQSVPAGRTGIELRLEAGGRIEGRVRRDGTAVTDFLLWVGAERGPVRVERRAARLVRDRGGMYEVSRLATGRYRVMVFAPGAMPAMVEGIEIDGVSPVPQRADFELERGGSLSGRVVTKGVGSGVAAAKVIVEGVPDVDDVSARIGAVFTDGEGNFRADGLARGTQSIRVMAVGHHGRLLGGIVVRSGEDAGPLQIELEPLAEGETPKLELAGIGAVLEPEGAFLVVRQTIDGGGAHDVGLAPGDRVAAIDGVTITELGFRGAIERIRGPVGSFVVLTVHRVGHETPVSVQVPRRQIRAG